MAPSSPLCVAALALALAGARAQPPPRDILASTLALELAFFDGKVPSCAATSKPPSNALLDATASCSVAAAAATTP